MIICEKCEIGVFHSTGARALYALICCHGDKYKMLVENVIQSQQDSSIRKAISDAFTILHG